MPTAPPPVAHGFVGATAMQLMAKRLRLGEVLIEMGLISEVQLERALEMQKAKGDRLGKVLINEGFVSSVDIAKALARRLDIDFVSLGDLSIDQATLEVLPYDVCKRNDLVPIEVTPFGMVVAMADPTNVMALDELKLISGKNPVELMATAPAVYKSRFNFGVRTYERVSSTACTLHIQDDPLPPEYYVGTLSNTVSLNGHAATVTCRRLSTTSADLLVEWDGKEPRPR